MTSLRGLIGRFSLRMSGNLQSEGRVEFSLDGSGRTILSRRQAGGLFHIGKPYRDGGILGAQFVNPTAGFFSGDEMRLLVDVQKGAQATITSPSATRFYAMTEGEAVVTQEIRVGENAWLEYHTNWVIPQNGSAVSQAIRLDVAKSGELFFVDRLAPGRVRHGEQYRYRRYAASFDLRYDGQLCARERMVLEPEAGGWPLRVSDWEVTFFGAVWIVSEKLNEKFSLLAELEKKINADGVLAGITMQGESVAVIRVLAARSLLLKQALDEVRVTAEAMLPLLTKGQRLIQTL